MNSKQLLQYLKKTASLKLTVVCLILLALLVVWGTLYQADHGLYRAQQKFFHSWIFFIWGFIPFPGTVLVLFVLFVNLVSALFFRVGFRLSNLGNLVTHTGILVLLVGSFFTFYFSQESVVVLGEGESTRFSFSEKEWELAVAEMRNGFRDVYAVDTAGVSKGDRLLFPSLGVELEVWEYYSHCKAEPITGAADNAGFITNIQGIGGLLPLPAAGEASDNCPGIVFKIKTGASKAMTGNSGNESVVLLYGANEDAVTVAMGERKLFYSLEKKRFTLPLEITLLDFRVEHYLNSQIPRSFESRVRIKSPQGLEREVVISMNKPLRYGDLAFFQSSYMVDESGREHTILAVVQNAGRLLPYVAGIWIFLGLIIHFIMRLGARAPRQ